jgi:hypothetical protein
MSFEQTKIFHNLVNHFVAYGNSILYDVGRKEKAHNLAEKLSKMHGEANIKKVCAKANQRLKTKLYTI